MKDTLLTPIVEVTKVKFWVWVVGLNKRVFGVNTMSGAIKRSETLVGGG
jgi:hypothetical protein